MCASIVALYQKNNLKNIGMKRIDIDARLKRAIFLYYNELIFPIKA
jgi:hypothetical protein